MKRQHAYITQDGEVFLDYMKAYKHADNAYGNKLLALASKLAQVEKYKEMSDLLDESLEPFLELHKLKRDREVIQRVPGCDDKGNYDDNDYDYDERNEP